MKREILRTLSVSGPRGHHVAGSSRQSAPSDIDERASLARTPSVSECEEVEPHSPPSAPISLIPSARRTPSTSAFSFRRRPVNVHDLECVKRELIDTLSDRIGKQIAEALIERGLVSNRRDSSSGSGSGSGSGSTGDTSNTSPAPGYSGYATAVAIEVPSYMARCISMENVVATDQQQQQQQDSNKTASGAVVLHI